MDDEVVIEEQPALEQSFLATGHQIDILADEVSCSVNMGVMIQYDQPQMRQIINYFEDCFNQPDCR